MYKFNVYMVCKNVQQLFILATGLHDLCGSICIHLHLFIQVFPLICHQLHECLYLF